MNIYLIRHGETEWNNRLVFQGRSDVPLNKRGREQAKRISRALKYKNVGLILSSGLSRADETASIIAENTGYKKRLVKDNLFMERFYGSLEGKNYKKNVDYERFNGEKDRDFFKRAERALKKILKTYGKKSENIAVVTHGGMVRAVAAVALKLRPGMYKRIRIYNASISEIHYDDKKGIYLTLLNNVSHLTYREQKKAEHHVKGI